MESPSRASYRNCCILVRLQQQFKLPTTSRPKPGAPLTEKCERSLLMGEVVKMWSPNAMNLVPL